jgi:hypothetical protein
MSHICHNEARIIQLEKEGAAMNTEIKNLVKSLDSLTGWIKALIIALIPIIFGSMGWLITQVFKK